MVDFFGWINLEGKYTSSSHGSVMGSLTGRFFWGVGVVQKDMDSHLFLFRSDLTLRIQVCPKDPGFPRNNPK